MRVKILTEEVAIDDKVIAVLGGPQDGNWKTYTLEEATGLANQLALAADMLFDMCDKARQVKAKTA